MSIRALKHIKTKASSLIEKRNNFETNLENLERLDNEYKKVNPKDKKDKETFKEAYEQQLITTRASFYELLDAIESPKGVSKGHTMFSAEKLSLETMVQVLNDIEPKYRAFLFSIKPEQLTENQLTSNTLTTILKLNKLALAIQNNLTKKLIEDRKKDGFVHFIADLKDKRYNQTHETWSLKNGLLRVDKAHLKDKTTIEEIHQFLGKDDVFGKKTWYEKPTLHNNLNLYQVKFKSLGKQVNKAVDPVFILRAKDGSLKVLCGSRHDDSLAFPGGMNESNVINTCINELLEECFSGDLFIKDSGTETLINQQKDKITQIKETMLDTFLHQLSLHDKPSSGDENFVSKMKRFIEEQDTLKALFNKLETTFNPKKMTVAQYICQFIEAIEQSKIDEGKIPPLVAHIKCDLYKQFLSTHYEDFSQFVKTKMHREPLEMNMSDPRNTDLGAMYTNPLEAILDESELTSYMAQQCALKFGEGDDLGKVKYRPIERLGVDGYSDHPKLLVDAINRGLQRGEITLTSQVLEQLNTIASHHKLEPISPRSIISTATCSS